LVCVRLSPAWLWLLAAVQIAIPATYYLGQRAQDDERFAWRMFSAVRLKRCTVEAFDGDVGVDSPARVDLTSALHASWTRSLGRGRERVIAHFLATRCSQPEVETASLVRRCQWPSGRRMPADRYRYECATGRFTVGP
jgi:hypothetical protein